MTETYITRDVPGTLELAATFALTLAPGSVVALTGELGAGKTVFTRGVAEALGVRDRVTSPTFTLINEYHGAYTVYHMDFYRLTTIDEMLDIGVDDYFFDDGICIVEWAEKMGELLPESAVKVTIRHRDNTRREITIERP